MGPEADVIVEIERIDPEVPLPKYHSDLAAGMDIHAAPAESVIILQPGERRLVSCGFRMALPPGYEAQIRPRSGLAFRLGLTLVNAPGTIDADYRGEVQVPLINLGTEPITVKRYMRIAQMVIAPVSRAVIHHVERLQTTERGEGGFGSTGL